MYISPAVERELKITKQRLLIVAEIEAKIALEEQAKKEQADIASARNAKNIARAQPN